jgi:nitrogen fixation protein NifU and related proteins
MAFDYTQKVLDHFTEPHNVGVITDADGIGEVGDASCGDFFLMFVKVKDENIADIKYLIKGCGAAIATCSALSDIAMNSSMTHALDLTDDDISDELGGLPLEKLHCSDLAATALHRAIHDYERRKKARLGPYRINVKPQEEGAQ